MDSPTCPAAMALCSTSTAEEQEGSWKGSKENCQPSAMPFVASSGLFTQLILWSPRELAFLSSSSELLAPALQALSQDIHIILPCALSLSKANNIFGTFFGIFINVLSFYLPSTAHKF